MYVRAATVRLAAIALVVPFLHITPAVAAPLPGSACSKAQSAAKTVVKINGVRYTCTKAGTAYKWLDPKCDKPALAKLLTRLDEANAAFPDKAAYEDELAKAKAWVQEEIDEGEADETAKARIEVARVESLYAAAVKAAKVQVRTAQAAITGCKASVG